MGAGLQRGGQTFREVTERGLAGNQQQLTNLMNLSNTVAAVNKAQAARNAAKASGLDDDLKKAGKRIEILSGRATNVNRMTQAALKRRGQIRDSLDIYVQSDPASLSKQDKEAMKRLQGELNRIDQNIAKLKDRQDLINSELIKESNILKGVTSDQWGVTGAEDTTTAVAQPEAETPAQKKKRMAEERKAKSGKPVTKEREGALGPRNPRASRLKPEFQKEGKFKSIQARRDTNPLTAIKPEDAPVERGGVIINKEDAELMNRLNRRIQEFEDRTSRSR